MEEKKKIKNNNVKTKSLKEDKGFEQLKNKSMKTKIIIILLVIFGLYFIDIIIYNYGYMNNIITYQGGVPIGFESDQCPEGQMKSSRYDYEDGTEKINSCETVKLCTGNKKWTSNCAPLIGDKGVYYACSSTCYEEGDFMMVGKPVIYLYPEEKTDVIVTLDYEGEMFADYPAYNHDINGWEVTALPDSTIFDKSDNKEYSYIFWEGKNYDTINWNIDKGFVVKGSETREFLQDILPKTGMNPREYNEFIVYWYPLMQENNYNLIHFAGTEYTDLAPLSTQPKFDSMLRVFMVAKPLDKPINIEPQNFENFERKGFTVVEWGGTLLNK